jgi:tripartite ATP-independent transporter DctM subunit
LKPGHCLKNLPGNWGKAMEMVPTHAAARPAETTPAAALLGGIVEAGAAGLVAVEIVILFAGVFARYVLKSPIGWVDELASILFLWLAMLGAAIALRRGEHMRMTAALNRFGEKSRVVMEALAVAAPFVVLALILPGAVGYALEEHVIRTPALGLPNSWRVVAMPAGIALMLVFSGLKLVRTPYALATLAATAGTFALLYAGSPLFAGLGNLNLIIFFIAALFGCVLAGIPIAFAFALTTFAYLAVTTDVPLSIIPGRMDEGMSHLILLSIPLFVFLGKLVEMTGMAKAMVEFLASLLGHVRGGLQYVLIAAMYLVSGISGSKVADMAAVAPVLFPEMRKRGARDGDLIALLSATGAQTETVPPSIVLITIGSVTGVSIASLFTGGLVPALVLGTILCVLVFWRTRNDDLSHVRRASGQEIGRALAIAAPALALPFVIRAAVVNGVATATEVSTLGIAYCALAGLLFYRRFVWRRLGELLVETASLSGAILLIIGTATAMAWALTQSGFSHQLADAMAKVPGGAAGFIVITIITFIVLGSVLEGIPAIVLFGPMLFPVAKSLGIHPVHYSMIVVLAMGIGLFSPPFGVGYYAACAIGKVHPDKGMREIGPYIVALFLGVIIVAAFPFLSTGFLK